MNIPFLDLKPTYTELQPEIDAAIKRVLDSGWYILGEEVDAFEREYAAYCEAQHCVGVANGLDALHLALLALGVGAGDEVIVPSNTYIATWLAVSQCGATLFTMRFARRMVNLLTRWMACRYCFSIPCRPRVRMMWRAYGITSSSLRQN